MGPEERPGLEAFGARIRLEQQAGNDILAAALRHAEESGLREKLDGLVVGMKARRVKGLDCDGSLGDNAQRIVATRLDELCAFVPRAFDPAQVEALHDMRIAAKRLRYVLEVTESCFGPYAPEAGKRTKELQDLLGEIHDCDVLVPRVLEIVGEQRNAAVADVVHRAGDAKDVDPALAAVHEGREAWRGPRGARRPPARPPRGPLRALPDVLDEARARGLPRPPGVRDRRAAGRRAAAGGGAGDRRSDRRTPTARLGSEPA